MQECPAEPPARACARMPFYRGYPAPVTARFTVTLLLAYYMCLGVGDANEQTYSRQEVGRSYSYRQHLLAWPFLKMMVEAF